MTTYNTAAEVRLQSDIASFVGDPLGYVMYNFPWREDRVLHVVDMPKYYQDMYQSEFGPDEWAIDFLNQWGEEIKKRAFNGTKPVDAIQFTTASGHGIGKSALSAWICKFILDTRPGSRGTVTANTVEQLKTKTWAQVGFWHRLSLTRHWFNFSAGRGAMMLSSTMKDKHGQSLAQEWFCSAQTCRAENSEAFAGQHAPTATSFYLFDEACHDDKTQVMSKRGWVPFSELTEADLLLTPKGWQKPSHVHVSHRKGPMLQFKKRGLSACVTPNHEMYGHSQKGVLKKVDADAVTELLSPRVVKWSAGDYDVSDDELRLLAWYGSEGHLIKNNYKPKNSGRGRPVLGKSYYGFGITNNKDVGISDLLDRLGLKWGKNRNQWLVYEQERANAFAEMGVGCLAKTLPAWVMNLSQRQAKLFLDVYREGDGYQRGGASVIYTSSPRMADMLHALATLAGYNSSMTKRLIKGQRKWIKDHWAVSSVDGYVVQWSETGARVKLTKPEAVDYDGMVYCATVPAGLLLTRREGTVIWSGNSGVPDAIYKVREGGLTDGEPMTFDFGNPTQNTGQFYQNTAGNKKHNYIVRAIDGRDVKITNKKLYQRWEEDYGVESDFFKVRARGLFPSQGSTQFMSGAKVATAMRRALPFIDKYTPLVLGVDVGRHGDDETVIYPRRGLDARTYKIHRLRGRDTVQVTEFIKKVFDEYIEMGITPQAIFVDQGNFGIGIVDNLEHAGYPVVGINFGGKCTDPRTYKRKDAEMWGDLRKDINRGLALPEPFQPDASDLEVQLTQRLFGYTLNDELIQLEKKKDMKTRLGADGGSPDIADALALTYAEAVASASHFKTLAGTQSVISDFDPANPPLQSPGNQVISDFNPSNPPKGVSR